MRIDCTSLISALYFRSKEGGKIRVFWAEQPAVSTGLGRTVLALVQDFDSQHWSSRVNTPSSVLDSNTVKGATLHVLNQTYQK